MGRFFVNFNDGSTIWRAQIAKKIAASDWATSARLWEELNPFCAAKVGGASASSSRKPWEGWVDVSVPRMGPVGFHFCPQDSSDVCFRGKTTQVKVFNFE
jgi:hypothetical protein